MASRDLPVYVWLPILLVAAVVCGALILNREAVQDWVFFRTYDPPANIEQIAQDGRFTEEGERLFFRAAP